MFAPEIEALLESGCALIVGTVSAGGTPHASRGWGLSICPDRASVRLLLDASDRVAIENVATTGVIAVTGCDVPTLHSVQLKGHASAPVATSDPADMKVVETFRTDFFASVSRTEGTPIALLERLLPSTFAACTVTVQEVYDQTPGPRAGSRLPSSS